MIGTASSSYEIAVADLLILFNVRAHSQSRKPSRPEWTAVKLEIRNDEGTQAGACRGTLCQRARPRKEAAVAATCEKSAGS